jgi:hypothetical protein
VGKVVDGHESDGVFRFQDSLEENSQESATFEDETQEFVACKD